MGKTLPPLPRLPVKVALRPPDPTFTSGGADADVSFSASGLDSLEANLLALGPAAIDAAGYEMAAILRETIVDSMDNFVPIDTGNLRDTANSDEYTPAMRNTGGVTKLACWYAAAGGNPEATAAPNRAARSRIAAIHDTGGHVVAPEKYALDQHDNPTYKHGYNYAVSGMATWKYLEKPFMARHADILPRIGRAVAEALGAGSGPFITRLATPTEETEPGGE